MLFLLFVRCIQPYLQYLGKKVKGDRGVGHFQKSVRDFEITRFQLWFLDFCIDFLISTVISLISLISRFLHWFPLISRFPDFFIDFQDFIMDFMIRIFIQYTYPPIEYHELFYPRWRNIPRGRRPRGIFTTEGRISMMFNKGGYEIIVLL